MIDHIVLCRLKPEVNAEKLEEMVRSSRSSLLKIPEVLRVSSGRNLSPESEWAFYFSVEVESREKLNITQDDPVYHKFIERVIRPNTEMHNTFNFETDPSKDLRYS